MRNFIFIVLLLSFSFASCRNLSVPVYDCPVYTGKSEFTEQPPLDSLKFTFSKEITCSEPCIYIIEASDEGACTPACTGRCINGRCLISRINETLLGKISRNSLTTTDLKKIIPLKTEILKNRISVKLQNGTLKPDYFYQLILTQEIKSIAGLPLINKQGEAKPITINILTAHSPYKEQAFFKQIHPPLNSKKNPVNLAWVVIGSDAEITESFEKHFYLEDPEHNLIELIRGKTVANCGKNIKTCFMMWIGKQLTPDTQYIIKNVTPLIAGDGSIIPPWHEFGGFKTGKLDWSWDIHISDIKTEEVTGCVNLGWTSDSVSLSWLENTDTSEKNKPQLMYGNYHEFSLSEQGNFRLTALGESGNIKQSGIIRIKPAETSKPDLEITEIYPNPIGKEPAQEFIEIHNSSNKTVNLDGYRITDNPEKEGDFLDGNELAPGEFAVIVGKNYDFDDKNDDFSLNNIKVIILDSSLLNAGMTNKGEPVYLFTPENKLESRYNAWFDLSSKEGISVNRNPYNTCDSVTDWFLSEPTPGY